MQILPDDSLCSTAENNTLVIEFIIISNIIIGIVPTMPWTGLADDLEDGVYRWTGEPTVINVSHSLYMHTCTHAHPHHI